MATSTQQTGTAAASGNSSHRLDLQGLRGIAVLLVVLYHAGDIVPGGFVGVDVFFVLSGFVIGASILRESDRTGSISLSGFYSRRVRRILPAHALMAVVTLVVFAIVQSPFGNQQVMAQTSASASVWLSNMALAKADGGNYFAPAAEENPFLHTWSLGVEEQFYIFLPIAMVAIFVSLAKRPGQTTRRLQVVLGTVAALSFLLSIALVNFEMQIDPGIAFLKFDPRTLGFYLSIGRFWELLAGVLLATVPVAAGPAASQTRLAVGAVGAALLLGVSFAFDDFTTFPGLAAVLPVVATLLMIWAGTNGSSPFARAMASPPLRFMGDNSYSWYLWHWPAIVLAALLFSHSRPVLLLAAALSLIPAVASRHFMEEPIRRNTSIKGRRALGLAVICVGVPLAVAAAVYMGANARWGLDEPNGWDDIPVAREAGCHVNDVRNIKPWDEEDCRFSPDAGGNGETVLIVGDSHASSLSTAVIRGGNELGYDVAVWSGSGCPFIDEVGPTAQLTECEEWVDDAYELIDQLDPVAVVVANRMPIYALPSEGEPDNPINRLAWRDGGTASTSEEAIEMWEQGSTATAETLAARGIPLIVLGTVPEFWPDFVDRYSLLRSDLAPEMDLLDIEARQAPLDAAAARALEGVEDSVFIDPTSTICPGETCRPFDGDQWLYYDPDHLNEPGSALLAPLVRDALTDILG